MNEETKNEEIKTEQSTDTVSRLFDDRDRDGGDRNSHEQPGKEESRNEETPALQKAEVLRKKLDKVEKNLVENHKYGRSNAQKVKNALKVVQRFADEGTLAEEEARELLGTLHLEEEHPDERNTPTHQASPFAPIFKVANQELQNILKYTDDEHLQDKVNAFDYFLSVGSKEEIDHVLEDLTDLMDNPLKLARKMLAIGERVYQESYRGIKEAGGFKNYLATKDQEIEKLHKKLDKLEKKLLQYEDFDHPRYRMDEMGDVEGSKPANDTISDLFDERDKVKRR
jgi:predicted translin family RNA/ssDNA-binding protein